VLTHAFEQVLDAAAADLRTAPMRANIERFSAGDAGHERIERDAFGVAAPLAAIYFGNWQRDLSQVMAPALREYLGAPTAQFLCNLLFDMTDVLAEAQFGRRLNRIRFGTYRWEEHIDNPRKYGTALDPATYNYVTSPTLIEQPERNLTLWGETSAALPRYLIVAQQYVMQQLGLAMRHGSNATGLEHLGNALHTVEDFYAHSNFIELAINHLQRTGDPKTGRLAESGLPIRDSRGRYRLTTGVFLLSDTLASLQKLLLQHLETAPSGLSQRINRVIIRRLLGDRAAARYDELMRLWNATPLPAIQRRLEQWLILPLRRAVAQLLQPLAEAAARQTGREAYPSPIGGRIVQVIEISHSQLAKDDSHHVYYGVARQLAICAVRDYWVEMQSAWSRRLQPTTPTLPGTRFQQFLNIYMNHPLAAGTWWAAIVNGGNQCIPAPAPAPPRPVARQPALIIDHFAFNEANLTRRHLLQINEVARVVAARGRTRPPVRTLRLVGHTDSRGSVNYNLGLGQRRTMAVQQALVQALERQQSGLARRLQFTHQSLGATQPAVRGDTQAARARNRRVEIFLN